MMSGAESCVTCVGHFGALTIVERTRGALVSRRPRRPQRLSSDVVSTRGAPERQDSGVHLPPARCIYPRTLLPPTQPHFLLEILLETILLATQKSIIEHSNTLHTTTTHAAQPSPAQHASHILHAPVACADGVANPEPTASIIVDQGRPFLRQVQHRYVCCANLPTRSQC